MNQSAIHVAMASDKRFAMHLCVAVASLLSNSTPEREIVLHILHDGLTDATKGNLEALRSIRNFHVDWIKICHDDFKDFEIPRNLSVMANVRLKLPDLLPDIDRALYLDCDIAVLKPIDPLWDSELADKLAGAVRDYGIKGRKIERIAIAGREFFNSGILLLNLKEMREEGVVESFIKARNGTPQPKNDQELLNITLKGRWKPLPLNWNVQAPVTLTESLENGFDDPAAVRAAIAEPAIIHYTSHKPSSYLFDGLGREEYFKYLAMTPYHAFKIQDRNWRTVIIRAAPKSLRTRIRHLLNRI